MTENSQFADERFRRQYELIEASYRAQGIPLAVHERDGRPVAVYAADRIVVRRDAEQDVRRLFGPDDLPPAEVRTIRGLVVLLVPDGRVPDVLAVIEGRLGPGIASYSYVLSITPVAACPATEPEPPAFPGNDIEPSPPPRDGDGEHPVRVGVSDTGLLADAARHGWLQGVTGEADALGGVDLATGEPTIPPYGGHGTFIAGVVRCIAPGAEVHVADHLPTGSAGTALDHEVVANLRELLDRGVDVINLSAGSPTIDGAAMLAFEVFHDEDLSEFPEVVIVAAAGNNADDVPFWPAAADWATGVGALAADQLHRAWFSNWGTSADVWAPGEALVNAFASGLYTYTEPPRTGAREVFTGMARWSGTSFATPLVVGLVAARMIRTGETALQARDAVLAAAAARALPGLGPALDPAQVI
ncbi:S8 family peptidase [Blastococcus mobilis]|uniref:Subtilase family protein n=1 Tax=Blastococcus mobilis TaxID=1938746 RepID=A0A238UR13_9ACTN|nr:S8/S53 family peptidase [Blastococcus mobilis]SNR24381.1 Subtilase family protein [Blastococcus mobilis]